MSEKLMVTKDEAIEIICAAFRYPSQIKQWDTTNDDEVRFTWRQTRFRVSLRSLGVEEVEDCFLAGSNIAILAESLLKRIWLDRPSLPAQEVTA